MQKFLLFTFRLIVQINKVVILFWLIVKLFEEPEQWLKMQKERDESLHEISSTGESSQWGQDDSSTNEAMDYFETIFTSFQGNVYIGKSNLKMQAQ